MSCAFQLKERVLVQRRRCRTIASLALRPWTAFLEARVVGIDQPGHAYICGEAAPNSKDVLVPHIQVNPLFDHSVVLLLLRFHLLERRHGGS
jgi:hypothetical protein